MNSAAWNWLRHDQEVANASCTTHLLLAMLGDGCKHQQRAAALLAWAADQEYPARFGSMTAACWLRRTSPFAGVQALEEA